MTEQDSEAMRQTEQHFLQGWVEKNGLDAILKLCDKIQGLEIDLAARDQEIALLRGAARADDERLRAAAEKAGIPYGGCDTPDDLVEEIARVRRQAIEYCMTKFEEYGGDVNSWRREMALAKKEAPQNEQG